MSEFVSSQALKEQGNKLFAIGKFDDAIKCYSKGIQVNQQMPQLYTNRALCYLKLGQWAQAQMDCRSALEQDHSLVKGHFFNGQALLEQGICDEAIKSLQRAYELARDQKLNYGDDIASVLRHAKKQQFMVQEEKRVKGEIALQNYLQRLMKEDTKRRLEIAQRTAAETMLPSEEVEPSIEEITHEHEQRLSELNAIFTEVDERRKKRDVPDYLCGKISFELMRDPVITPSGITYDRKDIEEHLQRVGHFDPVTRADLTQDQLTPNLAMKEVVDTFLAENAWAEDGY